MFKFSYSVKFMIVEEPTWDHRLDQYRLASVQEPVSHGLQWIQLLFMLAVLFLSTFALQRALKSALNKDTQAMREMNQRRERSTYNTVSNNDDAIEDAFE